MTPSFSSFDVLVIGAGPAGASAALRTRAAGLSTLLVEKSAFPRFRIGESLLPAANALLREIGVWPKLERNPAYIKKFGARFHLGHGDAEKTLVFSDGLVPGLDYSYQVDRARFDALLLDQAREAGVEVRTETTVTAVNPTADGHTVTLAPAGGAPATLFARYVIDAGGRDQFFPCELKAALEPAAFPKRLAIYNHFTGIPRPDGPAAGDTIIVRLPDGWFWLIPIDAERTSVGLVTTQTAFKAAGLAPAEHFARVVAAHPRLRALLADAKPALGCHVTADYSYTRRQFADGRMILAGDAAGFLDPIFSSGVYLALHSAKLAAKLVIDAARAGGRPISQRAARRYTEHVKRHSDVFHRLIDAFYDDHSFAVFMCPRPPFDISPGITSIVAGHTRLSWPLWWRFKLFLLACRLQRHWPLVPRIDLTSA